MDMSVAFSPLVFDDRSPRYIQVQKAIKNAIYNNKFHFEDAIPAERDLAEQLDVSRVTVRKAIDGLIDEGLLKRKRGAGTFVASRLEKSFSRLSSFSEDMISRGSVPRSEWLSKTIATVNPEEALALGLSPGSRIYRLNRVRYADNSTMALEYAVIPAFCIDDIESIQNSLYDALSIKGFRPMRALQRMRAISFDANNAALLGVKPGEAGLFIERRGFLADGRAVEFTKCYYRGDAYDVVAELCD